MDALKKAEHDLEAELGRQIGLNYAAMSIALHDEFGWGTRHIQTILNRTGYYWDRCGETNERSMLQMVEEETGIEIKSADTDKSWHDVPYLNGQIYQPQRMNKAQWIYMRQQQRKWVGAQVVACFVYTLHRREGWGMQRISRLLNAANDVKNQYDWDEKRLREACREIAKVRLIDETWNR